MARKRKVDPILQKNFNDWYATQPQGPVTALERPIRGITEICKREGVSVETFQDWRWMGFPLYTVKGKQGQATNYANPERIQAWYRWRELVQSGQIQIDLTALHPTQVGRS